MVSAESEVCPVCGRDHRMTAILKAVRWTLLAGCAAGAVHWFVLRENPAAPDNPAAANAATVDTQTAAASVQR
jgi:uncharacterized lipoprotein YmbA